MQDSAELVSIDEDRVTVESYSKWSLVLRGDTKPWKAQLKELGAKWNPRLKGGQGWIISKKKQAELEESFPQWNFHRELNKKPI